jgi:hypothetical protein
VHGHDRAGELKDPIARGFRDRCRARRTNHRLRHCGWLFRPHAG